MKATLEYNLPEEAVDHRLALEGADWRLVVANLDNHIRVALKHGHNLRDAGHALEEIRKRLQEEIDDRNLTLEC
jgi:hypothetical protein